MTIIMARARIQHTTIMAMKEELPRDPPLLVGVVVSMVDSVTAERSSRLL